MSGQDQRTELTKWYTENRTALVEALGYAKGTLEAVLRGDSIPTARIEGRVKTRESFLEKVLERKHYENPTAEITDLVGIRVVTFLGRDANKVASTIGATFEVLAEHSVNKRDALEYDRVGYLSEHLVCRLTPERRKLPECRQFESQLFEIQVRTVLQHAWAEIEHDRRYKFRGFLPEPIARQLSLLAGTLELADSNFDAITLEIDRLASIASSKGAGHDELQIDANTIFPIMSFVTEKFDIDTIDGTAHQGLESHGVLELRGFGIETRGQLANDLIDDEFRREYRSFINNYSEGRITSKLGLLRVAMMWQDVSRYFSKGYRGAWRVFVRRNFDFVVRKYGESKVQELLIEHKIRVEPPG